MRKIMLALAFAGAALSFGSVEASAGYDYPWCLTGRGVGSPGDCGYMSYNQCLASASGRGLSCNINPRYAFARQGYGGPGAYTDDGYAPPPRRRYRERYYAPY